MLNQAHHQIKQKSLVDTLALNVVLPCPGLLASMLWNTEVAFTNAKPHETWVNKDFQLTKSPLRASHLSRTLC